MKKKKPKSKKMIARNPYTLNVSGSGHTYLEGKSIRKPSFYKTLFQKGK